MDDPFYFTVDKARTGLCFIKSDNSKKTPDSVLNAVAVFVLPIHNLKWAATLSERLTHSVVVLINKEDNEGFLIEYINDNRGTVRILSGKLANMPMNIPRKNGYKTVSNLSNGFYSCYITQKRLFEFSKKFTTLRDYHNIVHNCQIYHRSLIVSAITNVFHYNLKQGENNTSHLSTSHEWVQIENNGIIYRKDILDGLCMNNVTTFTLSDKLKNRAIPIAEIENNCRLIYDEDKHTIIVPKNIDVNLNEEADYVSKLKQNLVEAFTRRNVDEAKSILRKFYKMDLSDEDTVEAEYILSNIWSIQRAVEHIKEICGFLQSVLDGKHDHNIFSNKQLDSGDKKTATDNAEVVVDPEEVNEESEDEEDGEYDEETETTAANSEVVNDKPRKSFMGRRLKRPSLKDLTRSSSIEAKSSLKIRITIPFWRVFDTEFKQTLNELVHIIRYKNSSLDLERLYEVYHEVGVHKRCVVLTKDFMRLWVVVNFTCQHKINLGSDVYENVMTTVKRDTNSQGKSIFKSQILNQSEIMLQYTRDLSDVVKSMNKLMGRLKDIAEREPIYYIDYDLPTYVVLYVVVVSLILGILYSCVDSLVTFVSIVPYIGVLVLIRLGRKLYAYYKM